jgi:Cu(I)/Ag(I) efflux system membrane fusion protein
MNPLPRVAIGASVLLAFAAAVLWWPKHSLPGPRTAMAPESSPEHEPPVLYWYDPMRPSVHFDAPGRSPFMDMDLVPRYADEASAAGIVEVDPRLAQSLGIRTHRVTRGTFWQRIDATGQVDVDERTIVAVTARTDGWIQQLHVRSEAEFIERGTVIAEIYSPTVDAALGEYALAREGRDAILLNAARDKLRALGIDTAAIAALDRGEPTPALLRLTAPRSGYVMDLAVRDGAPVRRDEPLLRIAPHDPVWIVAAIPEAQADGVRVGQRAEARLPSHRGRVFEGTVDYVYPALDAATRTMRARIVLPNKDDALHPGMYAEVTLYGGPRRDVLLVPSEAVIRTGERDVVILADDAGRFRPVPVRLGRERNDAFVVLAGLEEGDRVVTSGQFLIDSEANLRGAYRRMTPDTGGHVHGAKP